MSDTHSMTPDQYKMLWESGLEILDDNITLSFKFNDEVFENYSISLN